MKRTTLRRLYGNKCHYCGLACCFETINKPWSATVEHLIPALESPTGKRIAGFGNCVLSCYKCNKEMNRKKTQQIIESDPIKFKVFQIEKLEKRIGMTNDEALKLRMERNLFHLRAKMEII